MSDSIRRPEDDRFVVELTLTPVPPKKKGSAARVRVGVACTPKASESVLQEIRGCLPSRTFAALPSGRYVFALGARHGFVLSARPPDVSDGLVAAVEDAIFPIMRRQYIQLAACLDEAFNLARLRELVEDLYETVLRHVLNQKPIVPLEPGFLTVAVGPSLSVFRQHFGEDFDSSMLELSAGKPFAVVPNGHGKFLGIVGVCTDNHPFSEHLVSEYERVLSVLALEGELAAVRKAQQAIKEYLSEYGAMQKGIADKFGPLGSGQGTIDERYAARLIGSSYEAEA